MKFKKTLLGSLGTLSIAAPVAAVVSCGSSSKTNFDKTYTFEKIDWSRLQYEDVTINSWTDGDTFNCTNEKGETYNVRIENIDTPESHTQENGAWVDTVGLEHEYAIKAYEFGQKVIPVHTKARLALQTGQSYNRKVASVFYGDNFSKNYEVDILKQGLAMPFVDSAGLYLKMSSAAGILYYLGLPLGDAFNYAKNHHLGLMGASLEEVLKIHGSTSTEALEYKPASTKSVYNYADVDFWK